MLTLAVIGMTVLGPTTGRAAELQLRAECRCSGAVVTLGELAEIRTIDRQKAAALAAIELFPSPPPGGKRFVRLREIQDLLLMRGIKLVEHRFSGAAQVVVLGDRQAERAFGQYPMSLTAKHEARQQVVQAVTRYLQQQTAASESWKVEVALDESTVRLVAAAESDISVSGGTHPWLGHQRFEVAVHSADGPTVLAVDAQVSLPPPVVVAVRSLPRGTAIGIDDVKLERRGATEAQGETFQSINEVLGKETARSIASGKAVFASSVRTPLLVRRSNVVTVFVRSPGIRVRSIARAREEGGLGDLIAVESLENRKSYFARVCGIQEVEVYARAIRSDRAAANGPGRPTASR